MNTSATHKPCNNRIPAKSNPTRASLKAHRSSPLLSILTPYSLPYEL